METEVSFYFYALPSYRVRVRHGQRRLKLKLTVACCTIPMAIRWATRTLETGLSGEWQRSTGQGAVGPAPTLFPNPPLLLIQPGPPSRTPRGCLPNALRRALGDVSKRSGDLESGRGIRIDLAFGRDWFGSDVFGSSKTSASTRTERRRWTSANRRDARDARPSENEIS